MELPEITILSQQMNNILSGKTVDEITIGNEKVLNVNMAARPQSVGAFANHLDEFESVRNFITSATISSLVDLPFVFLFLSVICRVEMVSSGWSL